MMRGRFAEEEREEDGRPCAASDDNKNDHQGKGGKEAGLHGQRRPWLPGTRDLITVKSGQGHAVFLARLVKASASGFSGVRSSRWTRKRMTSSTCP